MQKTHIYEMEARDGYSGYNNPTKYGAYFDPYNGFSNTYGQHSMTIPSLTALVRDRGIVYSYMGHVHEKIHARAHFSISDGGVLNDKSETSGSLFSLLYRLTYWLSRKNAHRAASATFFHFPTSRSDHLNEERSCSHNSNTRRKDSTNH
jgi:hypothetical protein